MTQENPTRRQSHLLEDLRVVEQDIERLQRRRTSLRAELDRLYPSARELAIPKREKGTVLSIWNYKANHHTCRIYLTSEGTTQITNPNPIYLRDADVVIMALCSQPNGADATKLLEFPELLKVDASPKRRIHQLVRSNFLRLQFTTA